MAEAGNRNWTYSEYLNLRELLELQGEDRGISSDEMHFIIVHQTFELWFKQIIRELTDVRDILIQVPVPEDQIPMAVDHLGRTTEIFRLMASQWTVLETLTPQGFLAFRDGLGTASGFESYQMREFEILLGLENSERFGGIDPLDSFRRMVDDGEAKKEKPRECLLLSCTARSSSIAVRQTAVESVQPGGERTNFANRCER